MKSSQARTHNNLALAGSAGAQNAAARRATASRRGTHRRSCAPLAGSRLVICRHCAEASRASTAAQVVSEVFCWAREPMAVRKLAARKDELLEKAMVRRAPPRRAVTQTAGGTVALGIPRAPPRSA